MKKFFFFIALILVVSILSAQSDKKDRMLMGLIEATAYVNGQVYSVEKYNHLGNSIEKSTYNTNGTMELISSFQYDSKDRLTEEKVYKNSGSLIDSWTHAYNDRDLRISTEYYYLGKLNQKRTYVYNDQDKIEKVMIKGVDGKLIYIFTYDYLGQKKASVKRFNSINKEEFMWTYTYDTCGLLVKEVQSDLLRKSNKTLEYKNTLRPLTTQIREEVQDGVNSWQKKGKFEKLDEYSLRVNEQTRDEYISKLTQAKIDSLALLYNWKIQSSDYDADNETFLINFEYYGPVYIRVPLEKAKVIDKGLTELTFENPEFTLRNGFFALQSLDIVFHNDLFSFNNQDQIAFNPSDLKLNLNALEISLPDQKTNVASGSIRKSPALKSLVDTDIPVNQLVKEHSYALIIGNEDYKSYQPDLSDEVNVDFAMNDAEIMKEYCIRTMGIPERQVKLLKNATLAQMNQSIAWLTNLIRIENGKAEVFFYFSGHGLPDEITREGFLIPVDISGFNANQGISLNGLFQQLSLYPSKKVITIIDACFSGGARNEPLITMKGVKIVPRQGVPDGNMLVLTSSSGNESSGVYREQQHGYLTYFLLKKLQETKGDVPFKVLIDEVTANVQKETAISGKIQNPQTILSPKIEAIWEEWRVK
jgi:hypothetical protein